MIESYVGEILVHALLLLDKSVVAAAAAMYQEVTSTLMSLLMKAGLSLNVLWHGTSKPLPCVVDLFHVRDALNCILHLFGLLRMAQGSASVECVHWHSKLITACGRVNQLCIKGCIM